MIWESWANSHVEKTFLNRVTKGDDKRLRKLDELFSKKSNSIFICHNPPYGYLDIVNNEYTGNKNKHVGSKEVLKIIKKYKPKLVLCGHIHEGRGKVEIESTLVFNVGSSGDYIVFDTDKNKILESNFLK